MTILQKNNFRIQTIIKIVANDPIFEEQPIKAGLHIEKKCGDSYFAICDIKYNSHEGSAGIVDDYCARLLEIENDEWDLFKELYKTAKQLVETANMEVEQDE